MAASSFNELLGLMKATFLNFLSISRNPEHDIQFIFCSPLFFKSSSILNIYIMHLLMNSFVNERSVAGPCYRLNQFREIGSWKIGNSPCSTRIGLYPSSDTVRFRTSATVFRLSAEHNICWRDTRHPKAYGKSFSKSKANNFGS